MGVLDKIDKVVDEAEDKVQGATGVDLGGSGGGKNAADVKDKNEDTSQGVTDNPGQAVSEAAEGAGQAVDKAEDAVQSSTGVDVGGSGGGSGHTDTQTSESSVDVDLGGSGGDGSESDVAGGSSSSSSSSGSSGSSRKTGGSTQSAQQLRNQLTQRDKRGLPEDKKKIDKAQRFRDKNPLVSALNPQMDEALKTREQNLETQNKIEDQLDRVQGAPQGARFKVGDQTLTKEQLIDRLREQKSQVSQTISKNDKTLENFEDQRARQMRPDPRPITQGAIGRFINPNREVDNRKRDKELNVAGEAVVAGQDVIQQSEKFGKSVSEDLPAEQALSGVGGTISGIEQAGRGNFEQAAKDALIPGTQSDLEKKRSSQVEAGVAGGVGTLGGFILGGAGAVGKTAEMEAEKLTGSDIGGGVDGSTTGEALVGGGSRIAGQAAKNPGKFTAQEVGEEIGEGIATLGVGALAVSPDPTIEVKTPQKVQEGARVVTGDLGVRARDPTTKIDLKRTEGVTQRFEPREDGGRNQIVEGFDENLNPTGGGVRPETPISRREYLKEQLGLKDKSLSDQLPDLNTKRKGQLGGNPRAARKARKRAEQSQDQEVEPQPDTPGLFDQEDLFRDVNTKETRGEPPLPESVKVPKSGLVQSPDTELDQPQGIDQGQQPDLDIFQAQQPQQAQRFEQEQIFETRAELEQNLEQQFESQPEAVPEMRPDPTLTPRPEGEPESSKSGRGRAGNKESDAGNIFAPSLEGVVFGLEAKEQTKKDVFSGLEARGVPDRFL